MPVAEGQRVVEEPEEEEEDPWAAFGDDNDDDEENEGDFPPPSNEPGQDHSVTLLADLEAAAFFLVQHFLLKRKATLSKLWIQVVVWDAPPPPVMTEDDDDEDDGDGITTAATVVTESNTTTTTTTTTTTATPKEKLEFVLQSRGFANSVVTSSLSSSSKNEEISAGTIRQPQLFDAVIVLNNDNNNSNNLGGGDNHLDHFNNTIIHRSVVRGGLLLVPDKLLSHSQNNIKSNPPFWEDDSSWQLPAQPIDPSASSSRPGSTMMMWLQKWSCPIQRQTCVWLNANWAQEQGRLQNACVVTTVAEQEEKRLSEASITAAVTCLQSHGYCIVPQLLDAVTCQSWGTTVLHDLQRAADILRQRDGIDLYHPQNSRTEPATYRELSMREDLRMDLRHGPLLQELRNNGGNKKGGGDNAGSQPWTVKGQELQQQSSPQSSPQLPQHFFRGHPDLLQIVARTMNPKDPQLSPGNFGRWNFQGSGPDGSFQDLRVGPVGGIVSLPHSADQAVHADTPHLFEHVDRLPAHYINAFTLGCAADPRVGQTALVHGSHSLEFCAQNTTTTSTGTTPNGDPASEDGWKQFIVRPSLELGDVLLFDCRILHFGMANTSNDIQRPLLYTNMTQHWFHDPKNWDNEKCIFLEHDNSNAANHPME